MRREENRRVRAAERRREWRGGRVYFVSMGSNGLDQVIVQFGAEPVEVNSWLGHSLDTKEVSAAIVPPGKRASQMLRSFQKNLRNGLDKNGKYDYNALNFKFETCEEEE